MWSLFLIFGGAELIHFLYQNLPRYWSTRKAQMAHRGKSFKVKHFLWLNWSTPATPRLWGDRGTFIDLPKPQVTWQWKKIWQFHGTSKHCEIETRLILAVCQHCAIQGPSSKSKNLKGEIFIPDSSAHSVFSYSFNGTISTSSIQMPAGH